MAARKAKANGNGVVRRSARSKRISLKISFQDAAWLMGVAPYAIHSQWPAAKDALREFASSNAAVGALVATLDEAYRRITT